MDENDGDVIPEAFAKNQLLALMTTDLDGYLSEAPELAMHFKLWPEAMGQVPFNHGTLYVEGQRATQAIAENRDGQLELQVSIPPFGSAMWCAARGEQ